jgi:L-ascorbate metabolism protein UlaG (beta-lactamase superfamily)
MKNLLFTAFFSLGLSALVFSQEDNRPNMDEFNYDSHTLRIHFYGHGTLMLDFDGLIIHVDPVTAYVPAEAPKADLVLVTHEHGDHLDPPLINKLTQKETVIIGNPAVVAQLKKGTAMKNGDTQSVKGITIEAVPAYNTTKGRDRFHPKGRDNGYILTLGKKRIYIAGDTEDLPEMAHLKNIDIAFLPVNQPYTMTPEQAARAVKAFKPAIFYPYHFGDTDLEKIHKLIQPIKGVELRLRNMK